MAGTESMQMIAATLIMLIILSENFMTYLLIIALPLGDNVRLSGGNRSLLAPQTILPEIYTN